jgi:hypothetical protein
VERSTFAGQQKTCQWRAIETIAPIGQRLIAEPGSPSCVAHHRSACHRLRSRSGDLRLRDPGLILDLCSDVVFHDSSALGIIALVTRRHDRSSQSATYGLR